MNNFHINYKELRCSVHVIEKTSSWGKGVKISIIRPDNTLLNTITYSCLPEFDQYELYQSKTTEQLVDIALARLEADMVTEDFKLAAEYGLGLLLPFNK